MTSPADPLRAIVVVPARDEERRVASCLRALAAQEGIDPGAYEVVLVLDHCRDATLQTALATSAKLPHLRLTIRECHQPGAGHARRVGMDYACQRLIAAARPDGLIASTDADSRVATDWLAVQLALADAGAPAIGGRIDLDATEAATLAPSVLEDRARRARTRLARLHQRTSGYRSRPASVDTFARVPCDHHHFSGASFAVTARTYLDVGGLPPRGALEDEALQQALEDAGVAIHRSDRVLVTTSARTNGRASRGLARDLALADWRARRSFHGDQYCAESLLQHKTATVTVIVPAREVADTISDVVACVLSLRDIALVDELLVIDSASTDGTAAIAAAHGATVLQEDALLRQYGPAQGKGDAMWRALSAAHGDIVVFVDADTRNFSADFVTGLLGPLLTNPSIRLVKGAFRRPLRIDGTLVPDAGGRVTELVARPLLNLYAPHLAGFDQPLAGEFAAYADLLRQLPFPAGYGVEIATLIDAAALLGTDALAQVNLGERHNRHQSLRELSAMSYAVMVAAMTRLQSLQHADVAPSAHLVLPPAPDSETQETRAVTILERPALESISDSVSVRVP